MRIRRAVATAGNHRHSLASVEANGVDDERIAVPTSDGITAGRGIEDLHVGMRRTKVEMARRRRRLEIDDDLATALTDIDWPRGVHRQRQPEEVAPANRVGVALGLPGERGGC